MGRYQSVGWLMLPLLFVLGFTDWFSAGADVPMPVIHIDETALQSVAAVEQQPQDIIVFSPSWCPHCKPYIASAKTPEWLRLVVVESEAPRELGITSYPSLYHRESNQKIEIGRNGWRMLPTDLEVAATAFGIERKQQQAVGAVSVGTIDRSMLDNALWFFRSDGKPRKIGPITMTVPRDNGADWATVGEVTTIKLRKPVNVSWGLISSDVSTVSYDGRSVTLVLPDLPDISLRVK